MSYGPVMKLLNGKLKTMKMDSEDDATTSGGYKEDTPDQWSRSWCKTTTIDNTVNNRIIPWAIVLCNQQSNRRSLG